MFSFCFLNVKADSISRDVLYGCVVHSFYCSFLFQFGLSHLGDLLGSNTAAVANLSEYSIDNYCQFINKDDLRRKR